MRAGWNIVIIAEADAIVTHYFESFAKSQLFDKLSKRSQDLEEFVIEFSGICSIMES